VRVELLFITPDAEALIARSGRISHRSEDRASPKANARLVRNLIEWGHESVLEFAHAVFEIEGISRAAANQLVRHRLASFIQESQRYVAVRDRGFVLPPEIERRPALTAKASNHYRASLSLYEELLAAGVPKEDARYVLPLGTETRLVMCANFRELRHIIRLRGSPVAQWEIREVARRILTPLQEKAPNVFGDLEVNR